MPEGFPGGALSGSLVETSWKSGVDVGLGPF
jgi:hypothetical protein